MDRDLRDAVRALSLVRADLVATRASKADAERQWKAHAARQARQLAELRESLAMRDEDVAAPTPMAATKKPLDDDDASPEAEPEQDDAASPEPSKEQVVKDHVALLASVYDLQTQLQQARAQLLAQDAAHAQQRGEWALLREASARQLAETQESQRDLAREKQFQDEKFEFLRAEVDVLKRERDALQQQLHAEKKEQEKTAASPEAPAESEVDVGQLEREMRAVTEREELAAALARTAEEHAAEIQRLGEELAASQAAEAAAWKENEERGKQFDAERVAMVSAWKNEKHALEARVDELNEMLADREKQLSDQADELETLRGELARQREETDALARDRTDLVQQLQQIRDHASEQLRAHAKQEEDRMKTQRGEQEKLQHELTTLLTSFEAATAENAIKMSALQCRNDALQRALAASAVEAKAAEERDERAQHKVQGLERAVDVARRGLDQVRGQLEDQRRAVHNHQEQGISDIRQTCAALAERFHAELTRQRERLAAETGSRVATSEAEQFRLENELQLAQDAARTLQEQLVAAEQERDAQAQEHAETTEQLRAMLQDRELEVTRLTELVESEKKRFHATHDDQLAQVRLDHEQALRLAKEDQNKLAAQVEGLKQTHLALERDLELARGDVDRAEANQTHKQEAARSACIAVERRLEALEQQLMAAQDSATEILAPRSWLSLPPEIRELDDFLPQLQLFAGRLHTSLQLCAENARALHVLSNSPSASPTLLPDLSRLLRLADQWKRVFDAQGLALHVRLVRRSVLASLSQWYEEGDEPSGANVSPAPPPPFDMGSQEVAIVLQNWTSDLEKRQRVASWLKQIAEKTIRDGEDEDETTLELKDMTREVKDAFSMLIVPLLRQNRAIAVRVFTRRVCDIKSSYSPDETCWDMRIHVLARRPESGSLRRIPSMSSVSSVGSTTSSLASSLSLSSVASASKLQIIQARLQQMQQR